MFLNKFILLFLLFILFVQASEDAEIKSYGTSISIPPSWSYTNFGQSGFAYQLSTPAEQGDNFQENLNLVITPVAKGENIKTFIELSISELRKDLKDFKIISQSDATVVPYWHIYQFTANGLFAKAKQILIIQNDRVYVLTYTTLVDTYSFFSPQFEKIIKTFKILR